MNTGSLGRILVVDDEEAHVKALCEILGDHGYECVGFTSGKPALEALRNQKFDLMLSDLAMPEMGGIALLHAALETDGDLVGVIMTGEGTIATAVEAMKTGAVDYVLKPLKVSVVLPVLARALEVRRLRIENATLQRSIRERTDELEIANRELDAFCHSVSHDLRAPLRSVAGFANILLQDYSPSLDEEGERMLRRMASGARHMGLLVEDLLRLSRLGRQPLVMEPVCIDSIVRAAIQELRDEEPDRIVDVRIGDLPDSVGDAALLNQVFVNLLSNAFKFTRQKEKATVEVSSRIERDEQIYIVKDNGAGFDMGNAQELFRAFQRLHSTSQFEGNGVGLSIVQRVIERHGGRIWVEAAVDEGATFYFTLAPEG